MSEEERKKTELELVADCSGTQIRTETYTTQVSQKMALSMLCSATHTGRKAQASHTSEL